MLKIGITGGIGSGKTVICKFFELLNIPVFYADTAAKAAMKDDEHLITELKKAFGQETYSASGLLNRSYLASVVFNNQEALNQLNSLVHPAVFRAFDTWVAEKTDVPYVVKEAALLFESNSYKHCNYSILVSSPVELRIQRVIKRDAITKEQVWARITKQMPEEQKEKLADFILINNEKELIIPQILNLHRKFFKERRTVND